MPRYTIVVLGVALLFAIAAVAQMNAGSSTQSNTSTQSGTSTSSAQMGSSTSVEGCIVRAEQDYYIYPVSGQPQHIASTGKDVSGNVGQHVKLQGTSVPASSSSASTSGATSGAAGSMASSQPSSSGASSSGQDFAVVEVDTVAGACPDSIKQKAAAAGMSTSPK